MRKIQRRKSDFMVKRQRGSAAYPQFEGIGVQDVRWTSALYGPEWNGDLPLLNCQWMQSFYTHSF